MPAIACGFERAASALAAAHLELPLDDPFPTFQVLGTDLVFADPQSAHLRHRLGQPSLGFVQADQDQMSEAGKLLVIHTIGRVDHHGGKPLRLVQIALGAGDLAAHPVFDDMQPGRRAIAVTPFQSGIEKRARTCEIAVPACRQAAQELQHRVAGHLPARDDAAISAHQRERAADCNHLVQTLEIGQDAGVVAHAGRTHAFGHRLILTRLRRRQRRHALGRCLHGALEAAVRPLEVAATELCDAQIVPRQDRLGPDRQRRTEAHAEQRRLDGFLVASETGRAMGECRERGRFADHVIEFLEQHRRALGVVVRAPEPRHHPFDVAERGQRARLNQTIARGLGVGQHLVHEGARLLDITDVERKTRALQHGIESGSLAHAHVE